MIHEQQQPDTMPPARVVGRVHQPVAVIDPRTGRVIAGSVTGPELTGEE